MWERRLGVAVLCFLFLLVVPRIPVQSENQAEVIFQSKDARGDDWGAGGLLYPSHPVYVPGLFDLLEFTVSTDESYVYFDFQFAALTNPFQAPEGYFHQRLEVFVYTGSTLRRTDLEVGAYRLQTDPDLGWSLRLSIGPFHESRLYVLGEDSQTIVYYDEVTSSSLPEQKTIRVQVERKVLPQPDPAWGYYVLVGSFDGLATGAWRDLGEGLWQIGGTGVPIFDLLTPTRGSRSQRVQLAEGVLYPRLASKFPVAPWFLVICVVLVLLGAFCLWRWRHGRS